MELKIILKVNLTFKYTKKVMYHKEWKAFLHFVSVIIMILKHKICDIEWWGLVANRLSGISGKIMCQKLYWLRFYG